MSFDLISNILRQPWAIDPQYVEGVAPLLAALLEHGPVAWQKVSSEEPYAISARSSSSTPMSSAAPGSIAVIALSGPLMKNDQFCGPVGTARVGQQIREADANDKIDGIILKVDSPGGTVDGTEDLARVIKNTKKPIVAYIDGMAASAAYWIASSADELVAGGKSVMIGSIGAMFKIADMQPVLEKAGVKFHDVYATKSTDKNKEYRDAVKDGNYTGLINNFLDPLNSMFHSAVRTNRQGKLSAQENIFSGKTYFATDAKKHGLIDKIGSMDDAIKSVRTLTQSKNKPSMNNNTKYEAFDSFLGLDSSNITAEGGIYVQEEHIEKIDQLLSIPEQFSTGTDTMQLSAEATAKRVRDLRLQIAATVTERDTYKAKAEAYSKQQGERKWQNQFGRYSSNTLQDSNTTSDKMPSYLDPNNPLNQLADSRTRKA